ncbi:MAG: rhomboid family intramembrane serine protease [Caldilinea sp.]|uniref:rhomboid family intramembrane serine protease n=1 Tax=Caldilinea sp. TaxID=2293560 RepID=UPI0030A6BA38
MTRIDVRETALLRTEKVRRRLLRHAAILGGVVATLWIVELLDWLWLRGALDGFGIQPRTWSGLQAIVIAPWLHAGFGHLLANTIPFVVLGWFVMVRRTTDFFIVTLASLLASGAGIWLFGGASSIHLGASGVVFGFLGYLLARGYYERSVVAVAMAALAFFLYGGMLWGMLPLQQGISWQGHLFGFVGGVLVAYGQAQPRRELAP